METIRKVLDKIEELLTTEPARMIGYGAGVVIFLVLQVLNARGITILGPAVPFDQALATAGVVIAILVALVESIRRAVYSPQTFIEELSDAAIKAYADGHVDAHQEEADARAVDVPQKYEVPVGVVPKSDNLN